MYWKTLLKNGLKNKFGQMFATSREFLFFLSKRAKNDTIFRVAASLSYTSLIAIVPLFAIGLAIFRPFPFSTASEDKLKIFCSKTLFPPSSRKSASIFPNF